MVAHSIGRHNTDANGMEFQRETPRYSVTEKERGREKDRQRE